MVRKNKSIIEIDKSAEIYFSEIQKCKPLSRKEENELWTEYKKTGNIEARNKLVKSNLKFVASVAKNYQGMGLSYADLVSEGNVGLMRAMDKFDGTKGYKLISYSVWWIKQSILEALNKRNSIEAEDLPCETNKEEIEEEDVIESTMNDLFCCEETLEQKKENEKNIVNELLSELTDREQSIIIDYYGLDNKKPMTLEDIGKSIGLSKERVRQIISNALKKLRNEALLKSISRTIY